MSVGHDALEFLQAVYQNPEAPLAIRMRAAQIAIEYERPRLAVTAVINGDDWAQRLDRAVERSNAVRVIEALPAPPAEGDESVVVKERPAVGPSPTPIDAPFPSPRRR